MRVQVNRRVIEASYSHDGAADDIVRGRDKIIIIKINCIAPKSPGTPTQRRNKSDSVSIMYRLYYALRCK